MLRRLIILAALILIAGFMTSFLMQQDGVTIIEWLGWQIEIRTSLLVTAGVVLIVAVVMVDRLIGFIARLPYLLRHGLRQRRHDAGQEALALGLVAASVGDRREAVRQEKKARRLIGESMLTHLLTAQVAALEGKTDVASQYFSQLAENRDTAYFGEAGLMRLKLESGDDDAALAAGRAAFAHKKDEPALARALFTLEARRRNWSEAITALAVVRRNTQEEATRQHADRAMAVLHYLLASQQDEHEDRKTALKTLEKGLGFAPGLLPAAVLASAWYQDQNQHRKAVSVLEKAFMDTPHPDLAEALLVLSKGDETSRLTRLMQLADRGGNKPDALFIAARMAVAIELWGEALRLMEMIAEDDRDAASWALLAQIARHLPGTEEDAEAAYQTDACLERAATAPRGSVWQCQSCGVTSMTWQDTCPECDSFATLNWRRPAMAAAPLGAGDMLSSD